MNTFNEKLKPIDKKQVLQIIEEMRIGMGIKSSIEEIVKAYKTDDYIPHLGLASKFFKTPKVRFSDEKLYEKYASESGYYPWVDVLASMYVNSNNIFFVENNHCPTCKNEVLQILFRSPDWTWRNLCGREGYMTICPHCIKQLSFMLTIMN